MLRLFLFLLAPIALAEGRIHASAWREVVRAGNAAELHVVFRPGVPFDEARHAILAAGGSVDLLATRFLPSHRVITRAPRASLEALALDDRVVAVVGPRRFRLRNDNAVSAAVSHVTDLYEAPYGLSGSGMAVSLFELAEAQASHPEFGGRLHIAPSTAGGTLGDRRHATHVAGTIGAAGLRAGAKGMAPAATVHQFCVPYPGVNDCTGDWLALKDEQLAPLGIVVDNNSWGYYLGWSDGEPPVWYGQEDYFGAYELTETALLDRISADRGILFIHSAGNDGTVPTALRFDTWKRHLHVDENGDAVVGQQLCVTRDGSGGDCPGFCNAGCELALHHAQTPFDTMGMTASAKNVIAVGAVSTDLSIASLSSRGPAKDGRVKPDVVARGIGVLSTEPTNRYGVANGTSMAAPAVTGIAALLAEQWRRSHPGTNPTPEVLKALLIAGTDDLGNAGPDYTFGFGLVNAKRSVDLIVENRVQSFALEQSGTHEIRVAVDAPQHLRLVLNWPDPPIPYLGGDDIAQKALVNDLDLQVIDPAGNTILPWTLNKDDVDAPAVRGVNVVDPTEMIDIADAMPGIYRVIAIAKSVPEGPQTAVLVTSAPVVVSKALPKRRALR